MAFMTDARKAPFFQGPHALDGGAGRRADHILQVAWMTPGFQHELGRSGDGRRGEFRYACARGIPAATAPSARASMKHEDEGGGGAGRGACGIHQPFGNDDGPAEAFHEP